MNKINLAQSFSGRRLIFSSALIAIILGMLTLYSCTHDPLGIENTTGSISTDTIDLQINTVACSPDSVYFSNQILPIYIANCAISGCHDAASRREGVVLTDYKSIMRGIRAGDPNRSENYRVLVSSGESLMPRYPNSERGYSLPDEQISLVRKWIQQGAKNNYCNECDTTVYTFSGKIKSIIDLNCATSSACHASGSPYGNFTSYANINTEVSNGLFESNVLVNKTMPPGSPLPSCELTVIKKWLDAGAQNN